MITFTYLEKTQKERWLPVLFDLFYENMQAIAPSELPYKREKQQWLSQVSPALEKAPRQVILCFANNALAGYVQYYINGSLLMIEEIQIKQAYQRTTLFYCFGKYLAKMLPAELETVEAFAVKQNLRSRKLMEKLGMTQAGEDSNFVHLCGSAREIRQKFE